VARVLAALRSPETVLEILDVKVAALDFAERFRMKSLKIMSGRHTRIRRGDMILRSPMRVLSVRVE